MRAYTCNLVLTLMFFLSCNLARVWTGILAVILLLIAVIARARMDLFNSAEILVLFLIAVISRARVWTGKNVGKAISRAYGYPTLATCDIDVVCMNTFDCPKLDCSRPFFYITFATVRSIVFIYKLL